MLSLGVTQESIDQQRHQAVINKAAHHFVREEFPGDEQVSRWPLWSDRETRFELNSTFNIQRAYLAWSPPLPLAFSILINRKDS